MNNAEAVAKYKKSDKGKVTAKKSVARYRERYPEKYKAYDKLNYAVRSGKIEKQPCEICGEVKVQAHHEDYSKPLDVRWLCHKCHTAEHSTLDQSESEI